MADERMRARLEEDPYHRPKFCEECGGVMIFRGVGEYKCEECKHLQYDDYGKARLYLEEHPGATAAQLEDAIGVKQKSIRNMLREKRLEISADSNVFLLCEMCRKQIRSGIYCPECEIKHHRMVEEQLRHEKQIHKKKKEHGVAIQKVEEASGTKRFKR